jgi:hypothetical protein
MLLVDAITTPNTHTCTHAGTVDCAEFLLTFFKVGFAARAEQLQRRRDQQQRRSEAAAAHRQHTVEAATAAAAARTAPFDEADLEAAIALIVDAGARYTLISLHIHSCRSSLQYIAGRTVRAACGSKSCTRKRFCGVTSCCSTALATAVSSLFSYAALRTEVYTDAILAKYVDGHVVLQS